MLHSTVFQNQYSGSYNNLHESVCWKAQTHIHFYSSETLTDHSHRISVPAVDMSDTIGYGFFQDTTKSNIGHDKLFF